MSGNKSAGESASLAPLLVAAEPLSLLNMGFPKIRGTFVGVLSIRITVYWGLYWGPHTISCGSCQQPFLRYPHHEVLVGPFLYVLGPVTRVVARLHKTSFFFVMRGAPCNAKARRIRRLLMLTFSLAGWGFAA